MEEDIQNYSPTAMFRGTPCINGVFGWSQEIVNDASPGS